MYCFIHIKQTPYYARNREGITVEVYEVCVGDAYPLYMDRTGHTYNGSLCFDTIKELEKFYSIDRMKGVINND